MGGILWAVLESPLELPPRFECGEAHHCTLLHNCSAKYAELFIGTRLVIEPVSECWDERIQASKVRLPSGTPFDANRPNPHITVSYLKGVQPVEANSMLIRPHQEQPISIDKELVTVIEFLDWGTVDPLCPNCGSDWSVSNGRNDNLNQRRLCKHCKRTWTIQRREDGKSGEDGEGCSNSTKDQ